MTSPKDEYAHKPFSERVMHWLTTTNHKEIGKLYMATGLAFFVIGGLFALLIRLQLMFPDSTFLVPGNPAETAKAFNSLFTLHGTVMIFLFAMPFIFGFANYVCPLQIGARDLAFPRLNALSYWLLIPGGLTILIAVPLGGGADVGWTGYAPYSGAPTSARPGVDLWLMGQTVLGVSSTLTAVNFLVMILRMRAPGVSLFRMPLFTWSILVTVFLLLLAIPVFTVALVMLYLDRNLGTDFFNPAANADPLLWQHLFWYFGHPEVYILVLPAFGVISEVISTFSGRPIYGYRSMVYAIAGIGIVSYVVWGHHMFTTSMDPRMRFIFMITTMLVAVPTGIKIFNWLATILGGRIRFKTPMLFALGFIGMFTLGGITGIVLASVPLDYHLQETYYVVAHFHYVIFGGTIMSFFAGIYYWWPKMTGRMYNEKVGVIHFAILLIGFNMTFFPMHELGIMGMNRRISTYPAATGFGPLNYWASVGAFLIAASVLLMLLNLLWSRKHGAKAGDDPWGGWSLEWVTSSPPPPETFVRIPVLRVAEPLPPEPRTAKGFFSSKVREKRRSPSATVTVSTISVVASGVKPAPAAKKGGE
jgi:cytochrome c oxidase subunit 1